MTEGETLVVPHPRWQERDFVKAPLADLCGGGTGGSSSSGGQTVGGRHTAAAAAAAAAAGGGASSEEEGDEEPAAGGRAAADAGGLQRQLHLAARLWQEAGGERQLGTPDLECVLPMGRLGLWPYQRRTQVGWVWVARSAQPKGSPKMGYRDRYELTASTACQSEEAAGQLLACPPAPHSCLTLLTLCHTPLCF